MKSTVINGAVSLGLLLVLPGEATVVSTNYSVEETTSPRPIAHSSFLIAQCRTGRTANARGPEDTLIPYVVSPRNTAMLSDRPELRWNAVPGVDRYTVSLMNGETIVWTKEVQTNRIAYPVEVEPLQSGIHYSLVVKAANGRTSTEEDTEPSFYLLPAAQAVVIKQAETRLAEQATSETTALLQANLYAGSELYGEAIETLETVIDQGTSSAILYRQLGDWYGRLYLYLRAENYYLQAIPLAEGNLEEQARIQSALGELYEAIEQNQEAVKYFTQALENYEKLNNQFKVKEMREQIDSFSSIIRN